MALITRPQPGRGLRLAVAGAVLLTALTTATATAAPPTPTGVSAPARPRPGTAASATPSSRTDASTRPRTPIPGFLLKRGRYTKFDAPDAVVQTVPFGINNRGVIVGKFTTADGVDHGFRRDARGTVHHHRRPRRRRDPAHQDQRPRPDRRRLQRHQPRPG
jgi:hypothetical protein